MTLPSISICSFDDLEAIFVTIFTPPISYHTLLTNFTQIGLRKNERIRYFNLRFNKTLSKIPEDKRLNDPVVVNCYKNAMPLNVKCVIRTSQMDTLEEAMTKAMKMEEIMIGMGVDLEMILGKVQRQVGVLSIVIKEPLFQEIPKNSSHKRMKIKQLEENFSREPYHM
jgi:hypothetical protein